MIASVSRALQVVAERPELRTRLHANAAQLYQGLAAAGFTLGPIASPIVSLRMPDPERATVFWNRLLDAGIYVNLALPPATPAGQSLLRTSVTAEHTDAQIGHAIGAITDIGRELGLVRGPESLVAAE